MGLSESKPWQLSFKDILEKIRCYSACCGGQVIIEELDEIELEETQSNTDTDSDVTWLSVYLKEE